MHLLGFGRKSRQFAVDSSAVLAATSAGIVPSTAVDKHAVTITTLLYRLRHEQVHICRLEHVVVDFVVIRNRPYQMRTDELLSGQALQASPDTNMSTDLVAWVLSLMRLVDVDELLDVDRARAIVDADCDVGGLRVEGADLADSCDLGDGGAVDLEVGALEGFFGVEDLFDGYGAKRFVLVVLREFALALIELTLAVKMILPFPGRRHRLGCPAVNRRRRNRPSRRRLLRRS